MNVGEPPTNPDDGQRDVPEPGLRPWMSTPDPELSRRGLDYLNRFLFKSDEGLPEPDAQLAEVALSLVAGVASGLTSASFVFEAAGDTVKALEDGETPATLFARSQPPPTLSELLVEQFRAVAAEALADGEILRKVVAQIDARRNRTNERMTIELVFDPELAGQTAVGLGRLAMRQLEATGDDPPRN